MHFLGKTLLFFTLLHSIFQGQIFLLLQVFLDFLLFHLSKVRGGGQEELLCGLGQCWPEEIPHVRGQGQLGEATSRLRPGSVTMRSHPKPQASGGSWEEQPTSEARASSREEQPKDQWLRRHRRAYKSYPTLKVRNGSRQGDTPRPR